MTDRLLDSVLEGTGFVMSVNHDEYLLGIHDGSYADGECGLGHQVDVVIEETAVGDDGIGGQFFLTRAAGE